MAFGGDWKLRRSPDLIEWELWDGDLTTLSSVRFAETGREYYSLAFFPDLGPIAPLEPGTALRTSFDSSNIGATNGDGDGGVNDSLPWSVTGGGSVGDESLLPNPPTDPGMALFANNGRINFTSAKVDLGGVPNQDVIATIDFRTFEDSNGSDWEDDDRVEAWIEGSEDGLAFSRLAGGTVIPLATGGIPDELKPLELPNGAYRTFSSEGNEPIPPEIRYIRVHIAATNTSLSERFFVDNVTVRELGAAD